MSKIFITNSGNRQRLNIDDAVIIHRNFAGRETEYNRAGNRNFSVIIDEETAMDLRERGWNIRSRESKANPGEMFYFMPVTVNYQCNYPPQIWRIVDGVKTLLTEANVGVLDMSDIRVAKLVINARYWSNSGREGYKAYLDIAYFEVEEDAFASEYADFEVR